jgi:hypothetical protein
MKKIVIFGFNENIACFSHAIINVLDFDLKGYESKLVIEGGACGLLEELHENKLFKELVDKGLLDGVCKACSNKMGTIEFATKMGYTLLAQLYGHPSMEEYIKNGYEVITI